VCALELHEVEEIKKLSEVTPVYSAPGYVYGVVNIRGTIVTVIDMREKLGRTSHQPDSRSRIVVVRYEDEPVGLLVDSVDDAVEAPASLLFAPPAHNHGAENPYIQKVFKDDQRLIVILDSERILCADQQDTAAAFGVGEQTTV
jgi:purine-binding chemotaxis protein CheW